ncbi:MAG: hypothetical protein WBN09_13605 [Woeseiaceae bacterium]
MLIRYLPLLAALAPLLAVNIAYWLGVNYDHLPACFPYVDGCTSISATGRNPPGSFLFRAVHMPLSVLLVVIWYFAAAWLRSLCNDVANRWSNWIIGCGTLGAAALILYVTFLGTTEPFYEFMRRIGIYFYFLGTALAQLLVTLYFKRCCAANARSLAQAMLWLCLLPFGLGVLNLILKATLADADMSENRIEWLAALSMQCWYLVLFAAWRRTGFQVVVTTDSTSAR